MRTRDGHGIELRTDGKHAGLVPEARSGSGPAVAGPTTARSAPRLLALGLAVAVVLAVLAVVALAVSGGRDDVVATSEPTTPARVAEPSALGLTVDVPATVVAGERARFTVHWTDGSGVFSGSSEDWGDAVATSSRRQGRCEPVGATSTAAAGSYLLRHTWSEPGTYTVRAAVATYTCESGEAVEEVAGRTLTIEVLPAG